MSTFGAPLAGAVDSPPTPLDPGWLTLCVLAIVLPTALAYNVSPSATFFNQAAAFLGWGLLGGVVAGRATGGRGGLVGHSRAVAWLLPAAAVCLAAAAGWSAHAAFLPRSVALGAIALLATAAWVSLLGHWVGRSGQAQPAFAAVCMALLLAALLGLVLGLVQVFAPQWADGVLVALPTVAGKAIGNLRQPNHLATLLVWGMAGAVWLAGSSRPGRAVWGLLVALLAALTFGVVLTASRTGAAGVVLLAGWGLLDRSLSRPLRWTLLALPLVYAVGWGSMYALSHLEGQAFAAEARLHSGSDLSSSRLPVWRDTLALVQAHPWTGVGFGNFNFAWTLSAFPQRSVHFFDHTHNIVLQFMVELGLPLATGVLGLLGAALWALVRQGWSAAGSGPRGAGRRPGAAIGTRGARTALVIVLMVGWHSLLEYPLWYSYFLLPTVFVWGLALAPAPDDARVAAARSTQPPGLVDRLRRGLLLIGAAAVCTLTLGALADYWAISQIYAPGKHAGPLEQRIAKGQASPLFDYQAEYAAATLPDEDEPAAALEHFAKPLHHLIDTRLMKAYARALHESGDDLRAHYVVERLREFTRLRGDPFLDLCNELEPGQQPPFQCRPPPAGLQDLSWQDFLPRPAR